jgi:pimeloyl-ACP methyl ester carboxylesterase
MPVLVLAPAHSPLVPLRDSIRLYELAPRGEIVIINGATHEIYLDEQTKCERAYLEFLDQVPGAPLRSTR